MAGNNSGTHYCRRCVHCSPNDCHDVHHVLHTEYLLLWKHGFDIFPSASTGFQWNGMW